MSVQATSELVNSLCKFVELVNTTLSRLFLSFPHVGRRWPNCCFVPKWSATSIDSQSCWPRCTPICSSKSLKFFLNKPSRVTAASALDIKGKLVTNDILSGELQFAFCNVMFTVLTMDSTQSLISRRWDLQRLFWTTDVIRVLSLAMAALTCKNLVIILTFVDQSLLL